MILLFVFAISIISDSVVSDNDILMTKQTYGQCQRDLSVEGNPLKIAGVTYSTGIGTHATSMIPISVPDGAKALSGACGIDDEITGETSSVVFKILSGSEVLWTSQVKRKGQNATEFTVSVPNGSHKLYLLADEYDTNEYDHADWVNLRWLDTATKTKRTSTNYRRHNSDIFDDQGPIIREMISKARSSQQSLILIEKGEYHFYSAGSLKMSFFISNHDQPTFQPIAIPLVDLHDLTIDCSGSIFYFHDLIEPFLVLDSSNITIKNLHIDYWRPLDTEGTIESADFFSTSVHINKTKYPFHISSFKFVFEHESFETDSKSMILFEKETGRILSGTGDVSMIGLVSGGDDGYCTFTQNLRSKGAKKGDVIVFRNYDRPHPSIVVYRSNDTTIDNVSIHSTEGMAILCQRSDTISIVNSAVVNGKNRFHSSSADATHFSNCKGKIFVNNSEFEGMMDDAINVHSTSLKITSIVNKSCIKLGYMHEQSVGFETFLPGEKIQFIFSSTLENSEIRSVKNVVKISTTELLVVIEGEIPLEIAKGDAVENADFYPSVVFSNNVVKNNRARGCLFTTPKSVLVENNLFDYTSGSAVLLAGDAASWYESGACENVIIRNNKIINALTSSYQFTNAIFSIYPTVSSIKFQSKFYHRNVKIEGNIIETFDVPILYGISAENIEFVNNVINYNDDFPSWIQKVFQFNKVRNVTISGNSISPMKNFTMKDVALENTDQSEIHIE